VQTAEAHRRNLSRFNDWHSRIITDAVKSMDAAAVVAQDLTTVATNDFFVLA